MNHTLEKKERISGKSAVDRLVGSGRFCRAESIRYCVLEGNGLDFNRIMVSVPKKLFKRAVKRNLLKRRMREAYRTHKHLLGKKGVDILFVYGTKEILPYSEIERMLADILTDINS